ncbi:hypothetical protein BKA58DRAFT_388352, partial [Alternaria rosae]|uniref:uncharacterized protein n=1 Tax=Alternaria rosae TaxID=1187941 RepID=UPI001E8E86FD
MKIGHYDSSHASKRKMRSSRRKPDPDNNPIEIARLIACYERYRQSQLRFCSAFRAALPREVRDMVYDHLITSRRQHYVVERRDISTGIRSGLYITHDRGGRSFFDAQPPLPEDPAMCRDVWRYAEYTGEAVAKEISERWYCTGGFIIYTPQDCLLGKLLTQDVWQRGNVPADIVRYIRIHLSWDQIWGGASRVVADLENLFTLPNKDMKIIFQIDDHVEGLDPGPSQWPVLQSLLKAFAPCIHRLRAEGFTRIKVYQGVIRRLREKWPWNGSHRDITNWFDLQEEEFQKVFLGESGDDEDSRQRIADVLLKLS